MPARLMWLALAIGAFVAGGVITMAILESTSVADDPVLRPSEVTIVDIATPSSVSERKSLDEPWPFVGGLIGVCVVAAAYFVARATASRRRSK